MHSNLALLKSFYSLRNQIQRRLRLCHNSFFSFFFLHHFRHRFRAADRAEIANVEQMEKVIPLITREIVLCQYVCDLFFGVNVFDLDLWIEIHSVKYSIKRNSVGSWHLSNLWTSVFWLFSWSSLQYLQKCEVKQQSEKTSRLRKHNRHWITEDPCAEFESWFGCWCVFLMICHAAGLPTLSLWISLLGWRQNATLQYSNARDQGRDQLIKILDPIRAYFWQFSNESQLFFLELMVIKTWSCDFVLLLSCFVSQFVISLPTFLCMIIHNKRSCRDICITSSCTREFFFCSCGDPGFKHLSAINDNIFARFALKLSVTKKRRGQGMILVPPSWFVSSVHSSLGQCFVSSQSVLWRPHTRK